MKKPIHSTCPVTNAKFDADPFTPYTGIFKGGSNSGFFFSGNARLASYGKRQVLILCAVYVIGSAFQSLLIIFLKRSKSIIVILPHNIDCFEQI
jgi:hypothetical protein